ARVQPRDGCRLGSDNVVRAGGDQFGVQQAGCRTLDHGGGACVHVASGVGCLVRRSKRRPTPLPLTVAHFSVIGTYFPQFAGAARASSMDSTSIQAMIERGLAG